MLNQLTPFFITIFFSIWGINSITTSSLEDVNQILEATNKNLSELSTLEYSFYRLVNYKSQDIKQEFKGNFFFQIDSLSTDLGFNFQFENDDYKEIFNGSEFFELNQKDSTIKVTKKTTLNGSAFDDILETKSYFKNSVVTLKQSLSAIISDKTIKKTLSDTIINHDNYYLVKLVFEKRVINNLGLIKNLSADLDVTYEIFINKKTMFPYRILQYNNLEQDDFILTQFDKLRTNGIEKDRLSWFYSSYNKYKNKTERSFKIIGTSQQPPYFKLMRYDSNEEVDLNSFNKKIVLLEFWIRNCGYCISAVPKINALIKAYESKGLEVIGINPEDTKQQIGTFYRENKPLYNTLIDINGTVVSKYGVNAFPQVVLINKGKIIYSGTLDINKIKSSLDSAI